MSEYQYYEFRAVDRPLDQEAMDALRGISSRAEITSHGMVSTYNHRDFRGDPAKLMDQYFDAFVYVANWVRAGSPSGCRVGRSTSTRPGSTAPTAKTI